MRGSNFIDLTGQRFGRLTVVERAPDQVLSNGKHIVRWTCSCDCGNETAVLGENLRYGHTKSCGCLRADLLSRPKKHALVGSKLYGVWAGMIQRCENPKQEHYKNYGGRGIRVCDEWHDFRNFWADMHDGYAEGLQIDRIDTDGNYEPGNCRWATRSVNMRNTRRARLAFVEPFGAISLRDLSDLTGIPFKTLCSRYRDKRPILKEGECARLGLSLREETHA